MKVAWKIRIKILERARRTCHKSVQLRVDLLDYRDMIRSIYDDESAGAISDGSLRTAGEEPQGS